MTQLDPLTTAPSRPGVRGRDAITWVRVSWAAVPLTTAFSDAKVLTGRQKPLTEVAVLFAEVRTAAGHEGFGFSYAKRAGGPGMFAHLNEVADAVLGEDANDISRLWTKLVWAGASMGRSGLATQAVAALEIALWDLKARRADLPLAKLLGAERESVRCYNTSGGFLHAPIGEVLDNADAALARGIGGIKIKVGQPDTFADIERVHAVREHVGPAVPLMVDANQQWDRPTAQRMGRALDGLGLTWIEEPLDCLDAEGHAMLARSLDTAVATGEMLTSPAEHWELIRQRSADILQPDAARVGGITPFLRIAALADQHGLLLAPHFAMEIHIHLAAVYPSEPWLEHFEWLEPLFDHPLEIRDGRMLVPDRPGLGFNLSDQARAWTKESVEHA